MSGKSEFEVGDIIRGTIHGNAGVIREIVRIEEDGHVWRYPEYGETCPDGRQNEFYGSWNGDPWHEYGWEKVMHSDGKKATRPADVITVPGSHFEGSNG